MDRPQRRTNPPHHPPQNRLATTKRNYGTAGGAKMERMRAGPTYPPLAYTRDLGRCLWGVNTVNGVQERRSDVALRGYLVLCPDGTRVAGVDDDGLYVWDSSGQRRVTSDDSWGMVWSPDGASLLFCTEEGIHLLRSGTGGGNADTNRIMSSKATSLAWSPDGTRFAFCIWDEGVFVASLDGDHRQLVSGIAGDVTWSPDCTQVAYSVGIGRGIACVDIATGAQRQLTDHPEDGDPVWSPDGEVVAYGRYDPGELRAVRADGTNDTLLWGHRVSDVAWSPDSTRVACTSHGRYHNGKAVVIVDAASGQERLSIGGGSHPVWIDDESLVWLRWMGETLCVVDDEGKETDIYTHRGANAVLSPDGQHIAYINQDTYPDARLLVSDRYGRDARVLAVGETSEPMWLADSTRVAWISPDGAHTSTVDGTHRHHIPAACLWGGCCLPDLEISPDGTRMVHATKDGLLLSDTDNLETVLPGSSPLGSAAWSPDGTRLAYTSTEGLAIVDTDDQATVVPGSSPAESVVWSPDGTRLVYTSTEGLAIVDTSGPDKHVLAQEHPSRCLTWSPDGTHLVSYTPSDKEPSLRIVDTSTGNILTLTPGYQYDVSWSPDSTHILYSQYDEVVVIAAETGHTHRIIRDHACSDFRWASTHSVTSSPTSQVLR